MLASITIIPLSLLLSAVLSHTDSNLTQSDVVKFYEQKIPFDKLLQLILNQTAITQNHTPTQSEMFLLNAIGDEVRTDSGEFVAGLGCGPSVTKGI